ncbi:MAG: hypothetical protein AAFO61_01360, partial [Pseudomonadota bacterium]
MRKLLCIALASTFLVGAPVVAPVLLQPAQAQTLFDRLFPRAAQRRRERIYQRQLQREREIRAYNREIRRQRRAAQRKKRAPKIAKIQSSKFK